MYTNKTITLTFIMLIYFATYSQQAKVYNEYLEPIENVEIISILNKSNTYTNEKGMFDINKFKDDDTIYLFHNNYLPISIPILEVKNIKNNKIIMSYQSIYLDGVEAVVTVRNKKFKQEKRPIKIDVLKNDEIHKIGVQTSAEILEQASGVQVQKSQSGGGSPIIRGMEANKVLLVIDGVRMNNAIYRGGHLQNSITLDNNIIEQVDISYGPGSVNYGSDALGGVIHYYTKKPQKKTDSTFNVNGILSSSFSSGNRGFTTHGDISISKNKWGVLSSISYNKFGNVRMGKKRLHKYSDWGKVYHKRTLVNGIDSMVINKDTNTQLNTKYNQIDILQKIVFSVNKKLTLSLNTQYSESSNINRYDQLTKYSNNEFKFAEWYYGPQKRFLTALTATINNKNKLFDNASIIASFQDIEESRIRRKFKRLNKTYRIEDVKVWALNMDFSKEIFNHTKLFYGSEITYNNVISTSKETNIITKENSNTHTRYPDNGSNMSTGAIYANISQNHNNILWKFGNRLTFTSLDASFKDTSFIKLPFNNIGANSKAFSSSLGMVYSPTKSWSINTNFSSGFRTPNIDDFGKVFEKNDYVVIPNNNIKPEFAYTGEIGLSKSFHKSYTEKDSSISRLHFATISATGFYTLLDNLIARSYYSLNGNDSILYDGEMKRIQANQNFNEGVIYGVSGGVNISFNRSIKLNSTINYTVGRITTTNQPLAHIPPLFGKTNLTFEFKKWDFELYSIYNGWKKIKDYDQQGNDNDDEATAEGTPSWFTLNIRTNYQFNSRFSMQGGIQNIMDTHYKTFSSGISAMGRSFNIAAKWLF